MVAVIVPDSPAARRFWRSIHAGRAARRNTDVLRTPRLASCGTGSVDLAEFGDVFVGAVAVDGDGGQLGFDLGELVVGEVDVGGAEVLLDPFQLAGAGDWDEEVVLVQHPGQRHLGC